MKLNRKKELASKSLRVGKSRIVFNTEGLSEIKEAITKQDIKELYKEGIISIKPVKGRRKIKKRKTARGAGKIKKKIKKRKQVYVKITRKLREYVKQLKNNSIIDKELYKNLRKKIRMRFFKSKANLKEYLEGLEEVDLHEDKKSSEKKSEKKIKKKTIKKNAKEKEK